MYRPTIIVPIYKNNEIVEDNIFRRLHVLKLLKRRVPIFIII